MTRNELITPDGQPRYRQLEVGEEYQLGDWFIRQGTGEMVVINQHALDLLGSSVGLRKVQPTDTPAYRKIEENKQ